MLEQELNKYINWCKKYNLNEKDYNNFDLYLQAKNGAWWDDIEEAIENGSFTPNELNAIRELRSI